MTRATTWSLAWLLWAAGLVLPAFAAMWLGLVEWTWRGFVIAYVFMALISVAYSLLQRWVARRLEQRRRGSQSEP